MSQNWDVLVWVRADELNCSMCLTDPQKLSELLFFSGMVLFSSDVDTDITDVDMSDKSDLEKDLSDLVE